MRPRATRVLASKAPRGERAMRPGPSRGSGTSSPGGKLEAFDAFDHIRARGQRGGELLDEERHALGPIVQRRGERGCSASAERPGRRAPQSIPRRAARRRPPAAVPVRRRLRAQPPDADGRAAPRRFGRRRRSAAAPFRARRRGEAAPPASPRRPTGDRRGRTRWAYGRRFRRSSLRVRRRPSPGWSREPPARAQAAGARAGQRRSPSRRKHSGPVRRSERRSETRGAYGSLVSFAASM